MDLSASIPADLQPLVTEWLASGRYQSGQELVCDALRLLAEQEVDLAEVQDAITEWQNGDPGMDVDDAFDELRKKYNIDPQA